MGFDPQQFGKWLITIGVVIALIGSLTMILGRIGIFKLPGDLEFGSKNWHIYFPIASCVLISVILMIILWIVNYFRH